MNYYFWDSCVLIEYLKSNGCTDKVQNIEAFLADARSGKCQIYISSLSIAEILPSQICGNGTFQNFLDDFQGAFIVVTPTPYIMFVAAEIRDQTYQKTIGNGSSQVSNRKIDTPDAIILSSALYVQNAYNIRLNKFHTYDKGKRSSSCGGKTVPILGFESWCDPNVNDNDFVNQIINLPRGKPLHTNPIFF